MMEQRKELMTHTVGHAKDKKRAPTNGLKLYVRVVTESGPVKNFKEIRAYIKITTKIVSEYDQENPQSQTADNPVAPRERAAQPSRDIRKTS